MSQNSKYTEGLSSRNLWCLSRHACRITHVRYAGSSQSITFFGQYKRWTGYSAIILASQLHKNRWNMLHSRVTLKFITYAVTMLLS